MTSRGFEPPPIKTTALTLRLRPLGHNVSCTQAGYFNLQIIYNCTFSRTIVLSSNHASLVYEVLPYITYCSKILCNYIRRKPIPMFLRRHMLVVGVPTEEGKGGVAHHILLDTMTSYTSSYFVCIWLVARNCIFRLPWDAIQSTARSVVAIVVVHVFHHLPFSKSWPPVTCCSPVEQIHCTLQCYWEREPSDNPLPYWKNPLALSHELMWNISLCGRGMIHPVLAAWHRTASLQP